MRMKLAALALIASVLSAHAQVQGNYTLKDSSNPQQTFLMLLYTTGGKSAPVSISGDASGKVMSGIAGTTNPNGTALFVQGVTGGVPLLVNGSITCSNCSGSGVAVNYAGAIGPVGTPGGFKDASGNFQPNLGDVVNGEWVNIKGTLPAFASPPTVNIGTAPTIAVTGTFFQATQPVSGTVTANLGTIAGVATQTTSAAILTALGSPFQAGGSIGNTSFAATQATASLFNATVVGTGTFAAQVTGTVTANLGTLNGAATAANQTSVIGTAAAGTAATSSQLAGGIFNSSPLTLTTGQQAGLQVDASGFLKVNVVLGGGGSSTFGATFPTTGVALGMTQGGLLTGVTGTGGNLNVQCANCSGSGVSTVDKATFTAGTSIFAGTGGFFQTTATTNPLTTGQQGMWQMTATRAGFVNLRDSSANELGVAAAPLQVSLANTGANATGLLVTGTGGTFPVSQATAASLNATVVGTGTFAVQASIASAAAWGVNTLGSTTTGQSGQLGLGAVTTAAPTYTTAQSNALSLTTAGDLRTVFSNSTIGVTQATAASLNATVVGTGTFVTQSTVTQATSSNLKAQVDPLTPASWGIGTSTQNSASVANGHLILGQFNTAPTTITTGNMSPFQLDASGNLLVNVKAGGAGGGAVFGPTAVGSANANPPVVIGGTTTGAAGVNVVGVAVKLASTASLATDTSMVTNESPNSQLSAAIGTTVDAPCTLPASVTACSDTAVLKALANAAANPLATQVIANVIGGVGLNATPTLANGNGVVPTQAGAVLSTANPLFAAISDGTTKAKVEPASTPAAVTDAALAVAPIPSELHIGEIASNQIKVQVAQTVTASAYTTGNALGGLMTIANMARVSGSAGAAGTGGIVTGMALNSKSVQSVQVDVFFFDANPTGTTCTDKTAFSLATADFDKVVGMLSIPSTAANGAGWFASAVGSVGIPNYFPVTYDLASSTSLFACAVVRGAFTPAATTDVSFKFNSLRN